MLKGVVSVDRSFACFDCGYKAHQDKLPLTANPHPLNSFLWHYWRAGWFSSSFPNHVRV